MEAKKSKLQDQFKTDAANEVSSKHPQLFKGVAIFVNGYSSMYCGILLFHYCSGVYRLPALYFVE